MTQAIAGSGVVLKRGDQNSATLAVRSSRTVGSGNSKLRIFWRTPGTAGDVKTCSVVVSGTGTALSVNVTTSDVTVNSATNGGGTATSTVAQIIAALYANTTFRTNWDADTSDGDGTGTIAAAGSSTLSGGVDGETFSAIAEVKGVRGPGQNRNIIDVTSFDSNGWREFISTLADGGTLSFTINFNPSVTSHDNLKDDFENGGNYNWEMHFPDLYTSYVQFEGVVNAFEITAELEQAVQANITLKVSGQGTWYQ
jgi:hypothetical protein